MKKPKVFKAGKIELWVNFELNSFRYVYDSKGSGEYMLMDWPEPRWWKNTISRKILLDEESDVFLGYL